MSDLVKTNHLTMLKTTFTLSPDFPVKAINQGPNQKYYRLSIMSKLPVLIDEANTYFYLIPVQKSKDYKILVFNANHYLSICKDLSLSLNEYLTERVTRN